METVLTDSVNDVDLRARSTHLEPTTTNDDDAPPKSKLDDLTPEELAAIAEDDDGGGERDEKGRFVPRARLDELTAQRNAERERAAAAEAKAADLERQRAEEAEATRVAAERAKQVRDFDAERDALQAKFDDQGMEVAEFNNQMRALDKAEREQDRRIAKEEAIAEFERRDAERREKAQNETLKAAMQDAEAAAADFLADPDNAAYTTDKVRIAALNAYREEIYAEKDGNISWGELLVEAKKRVEEYLGATKKPAAAAETEQQRVARERREAQARIGAAASTLPGRPDGGVGARGTAAADDENDMTPEEWKKLSPAERRKRLEAMPAGKGS